MEKNSNNNNKENSQVKSLIGVVGFLSILVVGFLVGSFIRNLFIDFLNQNKDEWISVYNSENVFMYYNPSEIIHTQNDNVRMWVKITGESYREKAAKIWAKHGVPAEKYNNWAFDKVLLEYDCKNQNTRTTYVLSYDADGNVIYKEDHTTESSFSPVIPGSIDEKLYKIACENQSFLCKLPFFCKMIEIIKGK
jgi:hypothetical protein